VTSRPAFTRSDAVRELEGHGIRGAEVYLIDVLPLIEMMWADGSAQSVERDLLDKFMVQHVANVNALAGFPAVKLEDAQAFIERFLAARPSAETMEVLRKLIPVVRLGSSDNVRNEQYRKTILRWCLDIGASCTTEYPYGDHDRFSDAEKKCFEDIFASLH
jgi:hypothetical protein